MIARIWYGWTAPENAEEYERLLLNEVLPSISQKSGSGYKGHQVLKKTSATEIEFMTIIYFDSIATIKQFVGEDYQTAHIPEPAGKLLSKYNKKVEHYEVKDMNGSIYPK
ncbi:hypothetical protein QQ008_26545 [Fulvivirgaceae bacterium BMA10]|uniref:Antibiotic biosynthesis monooxygenase n=1 Tax=Splendidivirga corallicola TaxID=3051826 RepID=A0ABT8KZG8_9BACT|nr:hypothetical protein [Fulvivirgaceae bacterium BMA10]